MYNHSIEMVLILMALSIAVTSLAKKANRPYPIALVIVGATVGFLPILDAFGKMREFFVNDEIFRTAIIAIFLPALLGEASLKLSFDHIKENLRAIVSLAFLGTLLAYLVTGTLTYFILGLSLSTALVFGALMSATDPVSVISIFKTMGVNKRIAVIMEGESLINDGVAVVLFKISAFTLTGLMALGPIGITMGLVEFLKVVLGGTIIGLSLSFIVSQIISFFDDYPLENAFSIILFYGVYFISEYFHVSGVIAVVTAGLVFGNYGKEIGMTPTTRLSINVFWDTITLVANSLVFILVGLEISRINFVEHIIPIILAILIVLLGRSIAVYLSTIGAKLSTSWKHVLNWGGLKGSLSLALALSLPRDFPQREILLVITFGVVFFSLIVQGLTIAPLIRSLGLRKSVEGFKEYEHLIFGLQQAMAANKELDSLKKTGRVSPQVFDKLRVENDSRIENINIMLSELYLEYPELHLRQEDNIRKKLLIAEHQAVEELLDEGVLGTEVGEHRKHTILQELEILNLKQQDDQ